MRDPCRTRAATALCISVASRRGHACHFKPVYLQRTLNGLCQLKGAIHLTPPPLLPSLTCRSHLMDLYGEVVDEAIMQL